MVQVQYKSRKAKFVANDIIESHYEILIDRLIGAFPLETAKENDQLEFFKAKQCALASINKIIEYSILNEETEKYWQQVRTEIEAY